MIRHAVRATVAVAVLSFAVGLVACGGAETPTAQAQDAPPPPAQVGEAGDLTSDQIDLQRRAKQGDASAQINLGVMYATGLGVPQDDAEAVRWFRLAAEQGHATGQYNLGFRYNAGQGVPQDDAESARWFRLAAEQGDASAQSALGFKYDIGEGVPQDYAEAVRWYRLAAEQGDASAQRGLGFNYATGQGAPQDDVSAHMWLNLAAAAGGARGGAGAREAREMVAQNMTREQIAEAQARAREWIDANR